MLTEFDLRAEVYNLVKRIHKNRRHTGVCKEIYLVSCHLVAKTTVIHAEAGHPKAHEVAGNNEIPL